MKKLMALTLVILLAFSLNACDEGGGATPTLIPDNDSSSAENNNPVSAVPLAGVLPASAEVEEAIIADAPEEEDESEYDYPLAVGDIMEFGGYEWRVLELKGGKALVLSDKVLFKMPYQKPLSGYEFYITPITWEECDLRQYLNGEFYDASFSVEEKLLIAETALINHDNPWSGEPGGNNTIDRVFLLSTDEVLRYFGFNGEINKRQGGETFINDQFNENRVAKTSEGKDSWWWMRSPGAVWYACETNHIVAASVMINGGLGIQGEYVSNVYGGVRPALWLKLSAVSQSAK